MSSRRKRAPPVRVDEQMKRKLDWNMLEDRRRDESEGPSIRLSEPEEESSGPVCAGDAGAGASGAGDAGDPGASGAGDAEAGDAGAGASGAGDAGDPEAAGDAGAELSVSPQSVAPEAWSALIGEIRLHPDLPIRPGDASISLQQTSGRLTVKTESISVPVDGSLGGLSLEDLDWLQKRKILQLSHESCDQSVKLKFFLLESGLGRPEFLSEGSGRLKKANQLLQKVMKVFYHFIIPEVMENGKVKKCDTELERQNVEELYEHVRHAHQREEPPPRAGLQHPDLRPLLRAYQRQAVDWMLRRENAPGSAPLAQPQLHFLWRELVTLCGRKLFYNPHTGCLIREFPEAGTPWPGGILADEMGLGKTVEVLALILCHTRQNLEHLAPALAAGQSVNYFVPPRPPEGHSSRTHPSRPKTRVTKAALRQMLLTAIAEVKMGKGAFIKDIFSHLRTAHQYDTLKNRHLVRKVLNKLMEDEVVEQVKGRGLAASFKLGKNYRERKRRRRSRTTREAVEEKTGPQKQADASPDSRSHCDQTIADAEETPEDPGNLEIPTSPSDHSSSVPDFHFQCICGEPGLLDHKPRVQCLSCLLWQHAHCVHFKPEDLETTPFYCPHCLVAMTPVSSRATLIISPSSICHQWVDEINRHVRTSTLRVMVYQGVKVHGFIQPHFLSEQDVVITTYDVLRSELNYVDVPHGNSEDGRQFRQQKRYMAVPSPLVAVEWWRVCLDEAQMVECTTAKAAEMALRLTSINRWCVSGTPVQRGLEDLYGLVLFLGVDPYWVKHWWDQLLYRPYRCGNTAPLYSFIAPLMWRSSKKHVLDQIQIPPQTEEVHWLSFSPVEKHFYLRQREVCSRDALLRLRKISDWSLKLSSLDRRTVTTALCPLLRLRQACCHPQAVRGEFLPLQKSTMTMEELLASLLKKCRVECEEAHRMLVCALNGLAGLHIIRGEFSEAAEMYREVLRSSEEQKSRLKTDSLQKLHATHNLMELLSAKHPGIPPTLRDHRLKDEVELLKQHYMSKVKSEVCEAHQNLQLVLQRIQELRRSVNLRSPWWLEVIQKALQFSVEDDLVTRVQNELTSGYKHDLSKLSLAHKFRDARGLQLVLSTQIDELLKAQKTVQEAVKSLEGPPSHQLIQEATVCHLRPLRLMLNNCGFCKADKLFQDYESKLFTHTEKSRLAAFKETRTEEEEEEEEERFTATSRVLFGSSETEQALKATLSFARARRLDPALLEEASAFLELLENWKKECKALSKYCTSLRDHVSAIDELDMAKERLRVRLPDEPRAKHIIEPHEVEQNRMALLSDRAVARSQLQKKLGQLLYLTNLEKSQDTSGEGANPEPCPICAGTLGPQWAVLTCGHGFCNECVSIMVEQYSVGSGRRAIRCAVCRQVSSHAEIFYVSTARSSQHQQDVPVKGSHSTKVEAVVRVLMNIQRTEPGAKALVFSTWQDVLDIIAKALSDNSLEFTQINGIHQFQSNLSAFKHDEAMNILLLPLHIGSNGLNIIEATHVLLVEPILNAAQELQAIGRVHRIGQNKPTVVHRFLIRSTIEERMQAMLKTSDKSHSSASMKQCEACVFTVADLAELFTDLDSETRDAP